MTPEERDRWWAQTVMAVQRRDPRVHLAMLVTLILRHGRMEECDAGHTHVIERISIEELMHTVTDYGFTAKVAEQGVIEIQAVAKEDMHGDTAEFGGRDRTG